MKKRLGLVLLLPIAVFACGGDETSPAQPSPTGTAPLQATATPNVPTPTPESSSSPTPQAISTPSPTPQPPTKYRWELFDVATATKADLALDSNGSPGVAILLENPFNGYVKYASWNGTGFDIADVVEGWYFGPPALTFGPDDRPHITWHDHQDPQLFIPELGDVAHATLKEGEWETETVYSASHDGWDSSVAADSQGRVHIIAVDGGSSKLEYYHFDGQEWQLETLPTDTIFYEWGTSLAVDFNNTPHLMYHVAQTGKLYYAYKQDGQWSISELEDTGNVGKYVSMALTSDGRPVVSYLELTGPERGRSSGKVKVAELTSGASESPRWDITLLDTVDDLFLGATMVTSLALDLEGNPVVAYGSESAIKIAYQDGGQWHTETAATAQELPFSQWVALDIDSQGMLHLIYSEVESKEWPGIIGPIRYARGTPVS